ncbi:hypothetical protein BJY01DRAFT_230081 [Aspergillus pseudoustus]|uniref:Uncharacterized protein n=1 Tax=Aspergillus pseudoustus TaxID=1810923 RepID=A0ABR4ID86_9EURO
MKHRPRHPNVIFSFLPVLAAVVSSPFFRRYILGYTRQAPSINVCHFDLKHP